jgi:hypothetical protein
MLYFTLQEKFVAGFSASSSIHAQAIAFNQQMYLNNMRQRNAGYTTYSGPGYTGNRPVPAAQVHSVRNASAPVPKTTESPAAQPTQRLAQVLDVPLASSRLAVARSSVSFNSAEHLVSADATTAETTADAPTSRSSTTTRSSLARLFVCCGNRSSDSSD